MKAMMITGIGECVVRDMPVPLLAPDQVMLQVDHVGLCGSDLATFRGANPLASLPRIPGHEIGATIVAKGAEVTDDYAAGKRVLVIPYTECGACSACRTGRLNACRNNKTLGVQQEGGLAEKLAIKPERLILNDKLPLHHLAMVEPLSVGFHALRRGRVAATDTVVVIGGGMIGMGAILGALDANARVIVVEVSEGKRALIESLGVECFVNPGKGDAAAAIAEVTEGEGADLVIEAVGLPVTFRQTIEFVCYGGRVVYIGYAKEPVAYETRFFNLKELDIMGSRNALRIDFETVVDYLETNTTIADRLISRVFGWEDADQALGFWESQRDQVFKIMVDCQR